MVRWEDRPRFVDAQYELALSAEQEVFSFELEKTFHVFPHNWQTRAIVSLREKHDVMIRAGTGSGKSLIYQAMAVTKPEAIVLVIAPITVLMEDQVYILCVQSSPNR
jgi:ATP-dependent helicase YprA (DUF1998 family)